MTPIAYISKNGVLFKELPPEPMDLEPLYLVKALTDEEIAEIAMQCSDMDEYGNSQLKEYEFARAILRKASEK